MNYDYEKLEQLLIQKSFEELDPSQKDWVGNVMSKQEYEAQRRVLLESQILFQEKSPVPASNLAALQKHFKQQHQKSLIDYVKHPIAAYQAVLLAITIGILVWWLHPVEIQIKTETKAEIVQSIQHDTIFQEKIIYKDRIIQQTKTISSPPQRDTIYMPFADRKLFYQEGNKEKLEGKSMQDMKELLDFIVRNE